MMSEKVYNWMKSNTKNLLMNDVELFFAHFREMCNHNYSVENAVRVLKKQLVFSGI